MVGVIIDMTMSHGLKSGEQGSCYAVIFSSQRTEGDNGYGEMADRMEELAKTQPGYMGMEGVRGADGFGITISYWESLEAIKQWKQIAEHLVAQQRGMQQWYSRYEMKICKVERAYDFPR